MSLLKSNFIIMLFTAFLFSPAQADSLILNGSAVFTHLARDHYIGGLYLPAPNDDPDYILSASTAKRMQIVVKVPTWSPRRWSQIWQNNIAINNDSLSSDQSVQQALMTFTSFPRQDIKAGDEIIVDYTPNGNSRVLLNGDLVLEVAGTEFFNYMINTWIGKLPPTREFRQNILGQGTANQEQEDQLLNHKTQRAGLFSGWVAAEQAAIKAEQERINQARQAAAAELQKQRAEEAARQQELKRQAELKRQEELKLQQAQTAAKAVTPATAEAERLAKQRADQQRKQQAAQAQKPKAQAAVSSAKTKENEQQYHLNMLQWQLQRQIQATVTYPAWAKQFGQESLVELDLQVNRQQEVSNLKVRNDNTPDLLANEVKRAIAVAAPKTAIPSELAGDSWPVSVSYLFSLQNKPQPEVAMPVAPESIVKSSSSVSAKDLEAEYVQTQLERVTGNVQYPPGARILKKEGKVVVEFDIGKDGKVIEIRDLESSRHRELNQAITAAVKGSEPYPPLPIALKKEKLTLTLDYLFKL